LPFHPQMLEEANVRRIAAPRLYDRDFSTYIRQFTAPCQEVLLTYFYPAPE
jgi:hypothetical protein